MKGKDVEDLAPVVGGLDRQKFGVTSLGTEQSGEFLPDREAIVETINGNEIVAIATETVGTGVGGEGPIQGHQVIRIAAEGAAEEVAGAQTGIKQVFTSEARVEVQADVIVERRGAPVLGVGFAVLGRVSGGRGYVIAVFVNPVTRTVGCAVGVLATTESGGTQNENRISLKLGGGGELGSFKLTHLGLKAIHPTAQQGELLLELLHQLLELVGHFGDAIETGIEQGCRFVAGHGLATLEGAIGIASDAAVLLHQVGQGLIGPVGGLYIRKLADAGDLGGTRRGRVAIDITEIQLGRGGSHGGNQAKRHGSQQQLLEQIHLILTPKRGSFPRKANKS